MAYTVYFDTSIFLEMGARKSKYKKHIRKLISELSEERARIYTSIITVEEVSVAVYQRSTVARDTYGDINSIARIKGITKEISLTAAKHEAGLKDIALDERSHRNPKAPETEDEKIERICENRRRKWDCFHLATALDLGCTYLYTTDKKLRKRPEQLGLKNITAVFPDTPTASIRGPLTENVGTHKV